MAQEVLEILGTGKPCYGCHLRSDSGEEKSRGFSKGGWVSPSAPPSPLPPQVILWEMLAKVPWSEW